MTALFWLIAAALIAASLAMLVKPLLDTSQPVEPIARDPALSLHRQQYAELSRDLDAGVIGEEPYRQACLELEQRRREESGVIEAAPATPSRLSRWLTVGTVASCVPLASLLLYAKLGSPLAMTPLDPPAPELETAAGVHQLARGLDELTDGLKRKLERQPDNGPGWALLGRSYVELGRHAESVPAFERAVELVPDDAQLLADYADALGMANGRSLDGRPATLITRALEIEPDNPKALLLAATVAVRQGEYPRAIAYWEQVLADAPPGSTLAADVQANIADMQGRLRGDAPPPVARRSKPATAAPRAVSGTVSLAPAFAGRVASTDTVFVFARAVQGPPMPVAVLRASARDLPLSFRLDDSHSVMPGRTLSQAGAVTIVARISRSGTATAGAGDLQGMSDPVEVGREGVEIVIDKELR